MEQNDDPHELAGSIQKDCHEFVDKMLDYLKNKGRIKKVKSENIQDMTNIFFYKKLADIELRLRELERRTTISNN